MGEFINVLKNKAELKDDPLFNKIIGQERDLEFLLGELEEWISKSYFSSGIYPQMMTSLGPPPSSFELELSNLTYRAGEIHKLVRSEVFRMYRSIQQPDSIQRLYLPLFESAFQLLQPLRQPLIVFTTNYDPAIEDLCEGAADRYDLIDGFFHDVAAKAYLWRRSQFDQYPGPESKKHVVLFKVHGSTSWTKTPRGIVRSAAPIYTVDDSSHQNVLIYPARKKVAVEDPFFTAYDYFQRCMERCKLCVTIGYSFRDEDALTRLRSAASMNRDLKVLVLDPNSAEICSKKLIPLGVNAQPIGRSFGDEANKAGVMEVIRDGLALAVSSSS